MSLHPEKPTLLDYCCLSQGVPPQTLVTMLWLGESVPSRPSDFKSSWSHYSRLLVILCLWSGSWRELCFTVVQTMFSLLPQHLHQEPCGSWRATAWQWVCMCGFGGPQGPVLMSYLCAFLTRARCSAHGTVILGRGWPCSAARLCLLLYLWHQHHHLAVCFCGCVYLWVCTFTSVSIPGGRECRGAHSGSKYCVYQHNESSGTERERGGKRERERGRVEGRKGWRKPFSLCCFLPSRQPTPVVSIPSILHLLSPFFPPFLPFYFFAWPDQIAAPSLSTAFTPSI